MSNKDRKYSSFYMKSALLASENSHAKRSKVGIVLVKDGRIISSGWNGQPAHYDDCCEAEDKDGNLITLPTVIHAEANAILFCAKHGISTDSADAYITLSPCVNCSLLLVQAGIKHVYYLNEYRNTDGIEVLKKSNVTCKQISID